MLYITKYPCAYIYIYIYMHMRVYDVYTGYVCGAPKTDVRYQASMAWNGRRAPRGTSPELV